MKTFSRAAVLGLSLTSAAVLFHAPAQAAANTAAQEAQALLNAGKASEALSKLDDQLSNNPQDAEARFVRGLVLIKLNRNKDAIRMFADLTRDYPSLPEPYNNLAALYAAQGDYIKARDALQAAVTKNPSYALANENLGDIYVTLASAAYNKAASLNSNNANVRRKLSIVSQLASSGSNLRASGVPQPVAGAAPVSAPISAPAAVAPIAATPVTAAEPAAADTPEAPVLPGAAVKADDSYLNIEQSTAALAAVESWAKAWSAKDLDAYFAAYAPEFTPEGGVTRETWEAQRRERIAKAKQISVKVQKPEVSSIEDGGLRVSFTQAYQSDSYSDSTDKIVDLVRVGGAWKIVREYAR